MRIKISDIIKYLVYFLILCNLSIVKVFPFFTKSVVHWITFLLSFFLFFIVIAKKKLSYYYLGLIVLLFFFIISELFYSNVYLGTEIVNCIQSTYFFFYILLAPVVFTLLKSDKKYFLNLNNFIIFLVAISALMRIAVSVFYGMTGEYIFSDIAFEFAREGWTRDFVRRINMPSMTSLFIPLILWLLLDDKTKNKEKVGLIILLIIVEFFIFKVFLARSLMAYTCLMLIFMIIIKKKSKIKQFAFFLSLSILGIVFFYTEFVKSYIGSFSMSSELGLSGWARIVAAEYYFNKFLQNPFLGIGILTEEEMKINLMAGDISDIGILGFIFQYGAVGFLLFLYFFVRWLDISIYLSKIKANNDKSLVIGIVLMTLLVGINISCFYPGVIFCLPFASAIIEYLYYKNKKVMFRNERSGL